MRTCYVFVNGRRMGPVLLRPLGRFARLLDGQIVRVEFASRAVSAANEVE